MSKKSNYNKIAPISPFKQGKIRDVVKVKRRFTRIRSLHGTEKSEIDALVVDLIQVLADVGIRLNLVHTIAKGLIRLGWTKIKKLEG